MMKIKRTKDINKNIFRKNSLEYRLSPIALAISSVFMLSSCEQSDETVSLYTNAGDCTKKNTSQNDQCSIVYKNISQETIKTVSKYTTHQDCVAKFSEEKCTQNFIQNSTISSLETENKDNGQSGSFWMPLMTGYMIGRLIDGSVLDTTAVSISKPIFNSNNSINKKFVNTGSKNHKKTIIEGRTIKSSSSDIVLKSQLINTITRGGFGESVAKKQNYMQRQSIASPFKNSMGG